MSEFWSCCYILPDAFWFPTICLYIVKTYATFWGDASSLEPPSGTINTFDLLSMSLNASRYCSESLSLSALLPSTLLVLIVELMLLSDSHRLFASWRIWAAYPSPSRIASLLIPSAMLIFDLISPSELRILDLLILSLSACNSMLLLIYSGGLMSLISYLMQSIPHFILAWLRLCLMQELRLSLSSKVLSKTSLPISDLMLV